MQLEWCDGSGANNAKKSDSNGGDRQYQINAMWIEMVSGHSDLAGNEESVEIDCRPILLSV